ncbi:MAG: DUF4869 domain-containing protein [Clostridiales bacterium]|nr:DUF4869 domain-containing protein [Clostridiales bacterium]
MLKIWFGDMEDERYVHATSVYFKYVYRDEWITSSFAREVIKDIDHSNVLGAKVIDSPVLGAITPLQLAGGTKTLLLMKFDESKIFNASTCGNNCAKWILQIAQEKDLLIRLGYIMEFGDGSYEIQIMNSNRMVRNRLEYLDEAVKYV